MAKSASSNSNRSPSLPAPRYRPRWVIASLCFLFATLLSVAFLDFSPDQCSGGVVSPQEARQSPIRLIGSGPVGSVTALS